MERFVVWNVAGLTKFSKGEIVLTDWNADSNWEVRVYKTDCDWDFLLNENGNKVSYSLAFNRLRPINVPDLQYTAGVIEQRVMNKTFTDEKLDEASDYAKVVTDFQNLMMELRNKLSEMGNELLWKVNELELSADSHDSKKFNEAMADMKALSEFLEWKPMADIKALHSKLVWESEKKTYNPADMIG